MDQPQTVVRRRRAGVLRALGRPLGRRHARRRHHRHQGERALSRTCRTRPRCGSRSACELVSPDVLWNEITIDDPSGVREAVDVHLRVSPDAGLHAARVHLRRQSRVRRRQGTAEDPSRPGALTHWFYDGPLSTVHGPQSGGKVSIESCPARPRSSCSPCPRWRIRTSPGRVVLLCDYTAKTVRSVLSSIGRWTSRALRIVKTEPTVRVDPDLRLWVGGPVDAHSTWVVMAESQGPDEEQREIVSGRAAVRLALADAASCCRRRHRSRTQSSSAARCWSPGSSRTRSPQSSWLTTEVDPALIFGVPPEQMWEDGDSPPGRRPRESADEFRSALRRNPTISHCLQPWQLWLAERCGCSSETPQPAVQTTQTTTDPETQKLQTMAARFAPVDLTADVSKLPDNERQALAKLVAAAKIFDALFLRQVWEGNESMLLDLARDDSPLGRARRHYFLINKGPWSRLDAQRGVHSRRAAEARAGATSIRPARRRLKSRRG